LRWYGHVFRKDDDDDWVKNMLLWRLREPGKEAGPGKHRKRLWNDLHLKRSDAMDSSNWRKMIQGNWSNSNIDSDSTS